MSAYIPRSFAYVSYSKYFALIMVTWVMGILNALQIDTHV